MRFTAHLWTSQPRLRPDQRLQICRLFPLKQTARGDPLMGHHGACSQKDSSTTKSASGELSSVLPNGDARDGAAKVTEVKTFFLGCIPGDKKPQLAPPPPHSWQCPFSSSSQRWLQMCDPVSVFRPSCCKGPLVWPQAMAERTARGARLLPLQFVKAGMGSEGKGGILAGQPVVFGEDGKSSLCQKQLNPWTLEPSGSGCSVLLVGLLNLAISSPIF